MFDEEDDELEFINIEMLDADGQTMYEEDGDTPVSFNISADQYAAIQTIAENKDITFEQAFVGVLQKFLQLESKYFDSEVDHPVDDEDNEKQ